MGCRVGLPIPRSVCTCARRPECLLGRTGRSWT
jgi:hypothetical protein